MMTFVVFLVFGTTLAVALTVIVHTLAPAMPRIMALLSGQTETAFSPLVLRDRRPVPRSRPVTVSTQPARRAAA